MDTLFYLKMDTNYKCEWSSVFNSYSNCEKTFFYCNGYLTLLGLTALFKMDVFLIFNVIVWLNSFFCCRNVCSPLWKVQIGGETKCH